MKPTGATVKDPIRAPCSTIVHKGGGDTTCHIGATTSVDVTPCRPPPPRLLRNARQLSAYTCYHHSSRLSSSSAVVAPAISISLSWVLMTTIRRSCSKVWVLLAFVVCLSSECAFANFLSSMVLTHYIVMSTASCVVYFDAWFTVGS